MARGLWRANLLSGSLANDWSRSLAFFGRIVDSSASVSALFTFSASTRPEISVIFRFAAGGCYIGREVFSEKHHLPVIYLLYVRLPYYEQEPSLFRGGQRHRDPNIP
jgi:hypothetical protein